MRYRRWVFPVSLLILALYAAVYIGQDEAWTRIRRIALSFQLSANLTHVGWGLAIAALTIALTMLFGRWYCMLLCPMGTLQEVFSRLGRKLSKRRRFRKPAHPVFGVMEPQERHDSSSCAYESC